MVRLGDTRELSAWFRQCAASEVSELATFAAGLQREEAALRLALTEKWSSGPVEGQITRVKCVKRQMVRRVTRCSIAPAGSRD
jgi:transposase